MRYSRSTDQTLTWFKSSYSGSNGGQCLEAAARHNAVHIRDSKVSNGPQLAVSVAAFATFVRSVKADEPHA